MGAAPHWLRGQPASKSFHVSEHGGLKLGLTLTLWKTWSRTLRCPYGTPSFRNLKTQSRFPFVHGTRNGLSKDFSSPAAARTIDGICGSRRSGSWPSRLTAISMSTTTQEPS